MTEYHLGICTLCCCLISTHDIHDTLFCSYSLFLFFFLSLPFFVLVVWQQKLCVTKEIR